MKKVLLMTIAITAFMPRTVAQYYCSAEVDAQPAYNAHPAATITRPWTAQYSVSVHRDVQGSRVSMVDYTSFVNPYGSQSMPTFPTVYCDLPWRINVQDIQVLGDTLYFSGYYIDTSGNEGVIGWLPLPLSSSSTANAVTYRRIPFLQSINRFVLKRVSGSRINAVGIGSAQIGGGSWQTSKVVVNYPNIHSGLMPTYIELESNETADDILLFDSCSLVVVVGRDATTVPARLSIRKGNAMNVFFGAAPPFNPTHSII